MKELLKGGIIVSADGERSGDVLIESGKIVATGQLEEAQADVVTDVSGRLLFPGFIDSHTHFDLEVAGTVTADDFASGTRAALKGGTTCIVDFATQNKGETLAQALENWHRKADGKSSCDYGFHMAICDWNEQTKADLALMFEEGVSSFKLYMTYDACMVDDKALYEIIRELGRYKAFAGVHCENSDVIKALVSERKAAGDNRVLCHSLTRPACLEAEAVHRLLTIAGLAGVPVWIVHLTCREALEEIRAARQRGQIVHVETCPQYLLLTEDKYKLEGFEGARYICAPPLRRDEDREALWDALVAGEIQIVSTDHCSFTLAQKDMGRDDFTKIPGGMPGVETRGTLMYHYGVAEGRMDNARLCDVLSETPAKLMGLYPRKGVLAVGSDADIVVINPAGETQIRAAQQLQATDYSPFEGSVLKGSIEHVYLRGIHAVENGVVLTENAGQYVKRGTCQS